jgi:hypothetical protein
MNDLYRDPLVHVHARIKDLSARALELAKQLSEVSQFWEHHAADKESADELFTKAEGDLASAPSDAVIEREHTLSSLVSLLESLLERVPRHEAELSQIPHGHPPAQPHMPSSSMTLFLGDKMSELESVMGKLARAMRAIDEHAVVSAEGQLGHARIVKVSFKSGGVPFTYTGALVAPVGQYPVLGSQLSTYVRKDAAPLQARPKGMLTSIFRVLNITETVHTGDPEFDSLFALTAERPASAVVLNQIARAALLDISRFDVPTLVVEPGLARLAWSFDMTVETFEPLVRAAARSLREIRRLARPAHAPGSEQP